MFCGIAWPLLKSSVFIVFTSPFQVCVRRRARPARRFLVASAAVGVAFAKVKRRRTNERRV